MSANGNGNGGNGGTKGPGLASGFVSGATQAVAALGTSVQAAGTAAKVGATAALKGVELAGAGVNATAKISKTAVNAVGNIGAAGITTGKNVSLAALQASSVTSQAALKTGAELSKASLEAASVAGTASVKAAGEAAEEAAKQASVVTRAALEQGASVSVEGLKGAAQITLETTKVATKIATDAVKGLGELASLASQRGAAMMEKAKQRIEAQKQANKQTQGLRSKEILMISYVKQFNDEAATLIKAKKTELESNENTLETLLAILKDNYCASRWKRAKSMLSSEVACPTKEQRGSTLPKLFQYLKLYKMNCAALLQTMDREQKKAVAAMQLEGKQNIKNATEEQEFERFLDLFNQKMAEFANNIKVAQDKNTNDFNKFQTSFESLRDRSTLGNFKSNNILTTQSAGRYRSKTRKQKKRAKKTRKH